MSKVAPEIIMAFIINESIKQTLPDDIWKGNPKSVIKYQEFQDFVSYTLDMVKTGSWKEKIKKEFPSTESTNEG